MSKEQDYSTDMEAQNIATELQERFPMFENHDLSRVVFYRMKEKKSRVPTKITTTKFPFDAIGGTYIYFVEVYAKVWDFMSDEQRKIAIFEVLVAMHPDGFDEESNNYAKLRKRDVDEYSEVLCAAQGVYNWKEQGMKVTDIYELARDKEEEKEDLSEVEETETQ